MKSENTAPLLTVSHLKQYFKISGSYTVKAVEDVRFQIYPGETSGLVGGVRFREIHDWTQHYPSI